MRLVFLILFAVLLARMAAAEPFEATQPLDPSQIADVTGAALTFMAPRTLEPVPMGQLTIWGLRGLSTLDPRLLPELSAESLRLNLNGTELMSLPPPPADDAHAWGTAAAEVSKAAWSASEPVRRAGTEGVLGRFFDEMLNHLDPYSRYATPKEAASDANRRNGRAGLGIELTRTGSFSSSAKSSMPAPPRSPASTRATDCWRSATRSSPAPISARPRRSWPGLRTPQPCSPCAAPAASRAASASSAPSSLRRPCSPSARATCWSSASPASRATLPIC